MPRICQFVTDRIGGVDCIGLLPCFHCLVHLAQTGTDVPKMIIHRGIWFLQVLNGFQNGCQRLPSGKFFDSISKEIPRWRLEPGSPAGALRLGHR